MLCIMGNVKRSALSHVNGVSGSQQDAVKITQDNAGKVWPSQTLLRQRTLSCVYPGCMQVTVPNNSKTYVFVNLRRPKQTCNIMGTRLNVEHTFHTCHSSQS